MVTVWVIVATVLVFAWGWYRVYGYNMRKRPNRLVAHMLGFLLGSFPAMFFFYACAATFPPPGVEVPSTKAVTGLWIIFAVFVLMVLYLTSRPLPLSNDKQIRSSDKDGQ